MPKPAVCRTQTAPRGAACFWALVCAALFALPLPQGAVAQDGGYLTILQQRARALHLAEAPAWHDLLHEETTVLGATRSGVVSDWFFLSPQGRDDADAELQATLAAFFDPAPRAPRDEPAQCVFGARWRWLAAQLDFDPRRLPAQPCPRRDAWLASLKPDRVWVVFPSAYLNSPASMFGHTLLRLDGAEASRGTPLLAYAVNFAATTRERNGLVFALRGLSGGYRGQYSVLPYYEKVKEYARLESRDLWEYPLALDDAETERLLLHLWELRGAEFTYYFFTKNCSYQLLTLLRVARPSLQWGHAYDWRAIPSDTLRTLSPGFGPPTFRASLETQLRSQAAQLGDTQQALARELADGGRAADDPALAALDERDRARVLSQANDLLYYGFLSGGGDRDTVLPRSQALLRARASAGVPGGFASPPVPDTDPLAGHRTQRAALGVMAGDGLRALSLRWRPAYHELLDARAGYSPGQQLDFADLELRLDLRDGEVRPGTMNLIDIVSVAPRDAVFQPVSWRVRFAGEPAFANGGAFGAVLEGGPGLAYGSFGHVAGYAFLQARADANADYARGQSFGAGVLLGAVAQALPGWRLQLEAAALPSLAGAELDRRWLRLGQQWDLGRDSALRLELGMERVARHSDASAALRLQRYF